MFLDVGLQKLGNPNGNINYYSMIGSSFLPGHSIYTIAGYELSTTLITIDKKGVKIGLPTAGSVFDVTTSKIWGAYGNSIWGTPALGLFWDATFKGAAGNYRKTNNEEEK